MLPFRKPVCLNGDADAETLRNVLNENPAHFAAREAYIDLLTAEWNIEAACQLRLDGCLMVYELDGVDESVTLDWEDSYTALALATVYGSAEDHFMIGDFEMAEAMSEMLQDRDPEDHLDASSLLAFCYVALREWELLDETLE